MYMFLIKGTRLQWANQVNQTPIDQHRDMGKQKLVLLDGATVGLTKVDAIGGAKYARFR